MYNICNNLLLKDVEGETFYKNYSNTEIDASWKHLFHLLFAARDIQIRIDTHTGTPASIYNGDELRGD